MNTRVFALIAGVVYTIVGVMGLLGIGVTPMVHDPALAVEAQHGMLLGLFPVNLLHNIVHLGIGIWGIAAYYQTAGARTYAKGIAIIYGALAIMGLFPVLNTTFGLVPLYGHNIWLHAVTAGVAAYFGWAHAPARTTSRPASSTF